MPKKMKKKKKNKKKRKETYESLGAGIDKSKKPNSTYIHNHKWKPGAVAIKEIKKYQKSEFNLIPKAPFQRRIRSICAEIEPELRFKVEAVDCLQEATESYLTGLF